MRGTAGDDTTAFPEPEFTFKPENYVNSGNLNPDSEMISDFRETLAQSARDEILANGVRIFIYGRIEYDDVFGNHHWQNFCQFLLNGGAFAMCPDHNDMDNN